LKSFIFLLLAFIAEIIGTIGGFGSSVFFVPLANFYLDYHSVLGITALFHLSSNLSKILLFKEGLDKKLLINIGVPSVIFVIIGGFLSKGLPSSILEICLGFFLIALSVYFLINTNVKINTGKTQSIVGGSISGFAAGLLGTGGAVRGITMSAFNLEKNVYIATSAAIDMGVDFSRSIVYLINGYINKENIVYVPFLLIIGFVGTYIGKKILVHIPQNRFKKISLALILIIGLISVSRAFVIMLEE
jgi:uncharacterized membrane protein YfcA